MPTRSGSTTDRHGHDCLVTPLSRGRALLGATLLLILTSGVGCKDGSEEPSPQPDPYVGPWSASLTVSFVEQIVQGGELTTLPVDDVTIVCSGHFIDMAVPARLCTLLLEDGLLARSLDLPEQRLFVAFDLFSAEAPGFDRDEFPQGVGHAFAQESPPTWEWSKELVLRRQ